MRSRRAAALGAALLGLGLSACAGSGRTASSTPCGPVRREALDPGYLVHVLPGAAATRYRTDPPTSGPHQPAPPITGVVSQPLPRPVQVGLLESGKVLLQYERLSARDLARLRALGGARVVVAPALRLDAPDRIVVTAWTVKLSCSGLDAAAIRNFIRQHRDRGPG